MPSKGRGLCRAVLGPLLGIGLVSTWTSRAQTQKSEPSALVELQWQREVGAESCPTADAIRNGVEHRLSRRVFTLAEGPEPEETELVVVGRIEPFRDGWRAQMTMRQRSGELVGEREVVAPERRCESLLDTLALVLALMVDLPSRQVHIREPVPRAPEPGSADVKVQVEPAGAHAEAVPPSRSARVVGGLSAMTMTGLVPSLAIGPRMSVGVQAARLPRVQSEISVLGWSRVGQPDSSGADFALWTVGMAICPSLVASAAREFGACIGAAGGVVQAAGFGYQVNRAGMRGTAVATMRLELAQRLVGALWAQLDGGLGIPLVYQRFVQTGADGSRSTLYETARVAGSAALGVRIDFDGE